MLLHLKFSKMFHHIPDLLYLYRPTRILPSSFKSNLLFQDGNKSSEMCLICLDISKTVISLIKYSHCFLSLFYHIPAKVHPTIKHKLGNHCREFKSCIYLPSCTFFDLTASVQFQKTIWFFIQT